MINKHESELLKQLHELRAAIGHTADGVSWAQAIAEVRLLRSERDSARRAMLYDETALARVRADYFGPGVCDEDIWWMLERLAARPSP